MASWEKRCWVNNRGFRPLIGLSRSFAVDLCSMPFAICRSRLRCGCAEVDGIGGGSVFDWARGTIPLRLDLLIEGAMSVGVADLPLWYY